MSMGYQGSRLLRDAVARGTVVLSRYGKVRGGEVIDIGARQLRRWVNASGSRRRHRERRRLGVGVRDCYNRYRDTTPPILVVRWRRCDLGLLVVSMNGNKGVVRGKSSGAAHSGLFTHNERENEGERDNGDGQEPEVLDVRRRKCFGQKNCGVSGPALLLPQLASVHPPTPQ